MKISTNVSFEVKVHLVPENSKLDFFKKETAEYALDSLGFSGKANELFSQLGPNTENMVAVGLGKELDLTKDHYVRGAHKAAKFLEEKKVSKATVVVQSYGNVTDSLALQGAAEGVMQAAYAFDTYKTDKKTQTLAEVSFEASLNQADEIVQGVVNVLEGINLTRDLVNTPANDLYPETLADKVVEEFEGTEVSVEIFDKAALEELGAHALLAVSKGSAKEPRMIVLRYLPLGEDEPVVSLVGKGVTYDSGGYAIKNARGMSTMKADMAGAASMIGTMKALAKNNVQQNVVALIGATENMISGDALKNGDIIQTLKGTTVEVVNTDAEGRLVLADVLYYAATEINSTCIVDAATLTGAVVAALGTNMTGLLSNDQEIADKVLEASKVSGEDMWQLPITDEFREKMKGDFSDMMNSLKAPSGAGTISAAAFLEHFVEEVPWVHLDIAGTAYAGSSGNKYLPKGASGTPVKTLYQFVENSIT